MRNIVNSFVPILLCIMCGLVCMSCGKTSTASPDILAQILEQLDNIASYEMTVVYSESAEDGEADVALHSNSKTTIKFVKPKRLFIDVVGTVTMTSEAGKQNQTIRIYSTFDGTHQRARYSAESNGHSITNSIVMDMSINPPANPFNGWNLKGFGLLEGKDYIGTIKVMINQYDFKKSDQNGNIVTFTGTINVPKCAAMLSNMENMPTNSALRFAESIAESHKAFSLRVDTARNLVVGFTLRDVFGGAVATRECLFDNIRVNETVDPDVFVFKSMPNETFTDITKNFRGYRSSSKPTNTMKESL